jgi:hypothetical protein
MLYMSSIDAAVEPKIRTESFVQPVLGWTVLRLLKNVLEAGVRPRWVPVVCGNGGYEVVATYHDKSTVTIGAEDGEAILPNMFYRTINLRIDGVGVSAKHGAVYVGEGLQTQIRLLKPEDMLTTAPSVTLCAVHNAPVEVEEHRSFPGVWWCKHCKAVDAVRLSSRDPFAD